MADVRPRANRALMCIAMAVMVMSCDGATVADGIAAYKNRDHARALEILQPLADRGEADAQYWIGVMHALGRGTGKDEDEALHWYRRAADQGHVAALYELAYHYDHKSGDHAAAVPWYRKAAARGDHMSLFRLARMSHRGTGAPYDPERAVALYRKAASAGNIYAQYILGRMYEAGIDVPRDAAEAARWYRRGAEQGEPQSAIRLALLYEAGRGVRQDDRAAVRWYRAAGRYSNVGPLPVARLRALHREGRATRDDIRFEHRQWYLPPY